MENDDTFDIRESSDRMEIIPNGDVPPRELINDLLDDAFSDYIVSSVVLAQRDNGVIVMGIVLRKKQ